MEKLKPADILFPEEAQRRANHCCATCNSQLIAWENFRDELSRKEFRISGMCQACQNSVFDVEEEA